ncbi:MAG: AAA family ATPase [Cyanobium sp.]
MLKGYRISEKVQETGHSLLLRAVREKDQTTVILKVLKDIGADLSQLTRFRREFEITSQLEIPGIIRSYEIKPFEKGLVIIFQDIGGVTLQDLTEDRPLALNAFIEIALQLAETLGNLHQHSIIHKDICPSNIIVNPGTWEARISDFGISTDLSVEHPQARALQAMEGTMAYMSPEQTGRMNRNLDYRTDFYSLGATFYQMATGCPPFETDDPIALAHSHLARDPIPAQQRNSEIPLPLSLIISKLLEKKAEDRYQSTSGLIADLKRVRTGVDEDTFLPGMDDRSIRFSIPQKCYGREAEVQQLVNVFLETGQGRAQTMLITGGSGSGKTALVQQLYRPILRERGYFIAGKFDPLKRNVPYSAVVDAFRQLAQQLATEAEQTLLEWREDLNRALEPNGQLVLDVIPDLEVILGPQEPVPRLEPAQALSRFNRTMGQLLQALTSRDTPVVLFLDDLQWADTATLNLLKVALTDLSIKRFLILGSYRDNEITAMHPLALMLDEVREEGGKVTTLHLEQLLKVDVAELIADTLAIEPEVGDMLAAIVTEKTLGNPFFVRQYLEKLHDDGLIFQAAASPGEVPRWRWNLDQIRTSPITDNVVDLLLERLRQLPEETQELLCLAACIGYQFDLHTLAMIASSSPKETFARLQCALREGFILPASDLSMSDRDDVFSPLLIEQFNFQHDRIRQAAYALVDADSQQQNHLRIGRQFLRTLPKHRQQERLFEIVDHLSRGRPWIKSRDESNQVAQLSLAASRKAYEATAYGVALGYVRSAHEMLPAGSWESSYELASAIAFLRADLEYLNGHFDLCTKFVNLSLRQARTDLEKAEVYCTRIAQLTLLARQDQAVSAGRKALHLVGVEMPSRSLDAAGRKAFEDAATRLAGVEPSSLLDQPSATDPRVRLAQRCLRHLTITAFLGNQSLWPWIVGTSVCLSIEHGCAPESPVSYANFGILQGAILQNYETGYAYGQMALKLCDRFHGQAGLAPVCLIVGAELMPWREPVAEARKVITRGYKEAMETGYILWAGYLLMYEILFDVFRGIRIDTVLESIGERLEFTRQTQNRGAEVVIRAFELILSRMAGRPQDGSDPEAAMQTESSYLAECEQQQQYMALCLYKILLAQHLYSFGEQGKALELTTEIEPHLSFIINHPNLADHLLIQGLCLLSHPTEETASEERSHAVRIDQILKQLTTWAQNCPHNYLAKKLMLEAQMAHVSGAFERATDIFDQAIDAAESSEMPQDEALANELAARSILSRKPTSRMGVMYLRNAHHAYLMWGAKAKLNHLEEEFPELLTEYRSSLERAYTSSRLKPLPQQTIAATGANHDLDLATLMKACEAISGEVVLGSMLQRLLEILIENAGAQRGVILLCRDGQLSIDAESSIDPDHESTLTSIPLQGLKEDNLLPLGLINYVFRTKETIILDDASQDINFVSAQYIQARTAKSILCQPILCRGDLIGIVYLENNLTTAAFTHRRVQFLSLLSGQIAVSIDNARLVENLEAEVRKRTEELELRSRFIEQIFGSYMSTAVADRLLRSPEDLDFSGKRQTATILFSDLRGFTAFSETLPPETVVKLLNNYLSEMALVVDKYGGTIDSFIGDGIMVVFGSPIQRLDDTDRAVACALAMQIVMPKVNTWNLENTIPEIEMGIGIHTGEVVVGNIGSRLRAKYGPVGKTVTICSRVESYTVGGQVLISEAARQAMKVDPILTRSFTVEPKGMIETLHLHDVGGIGSPYDLLLPSHRVEWMDLQPALPFSFQPISGKEVVETEQYGLMTRLSREEAEIQCPSDLAPHTNLKLQIRPGFAADQLYSFYAKVLPSTLPKGWLKLHFTSVPAEARQMLDALLAASA